eukprot:756155-Hanusia_phi.AAC.4
MKGSRRHGYGKYTWADGTVYEGEYVDDLRNGEGQGYYMASEYQYVGSWRDDSMEGEGVYECLDKRKNVIRIFQGTFEKQFPVSGTLQTSDGQIHEVCYDGATLPDTKPWPARPLPDPGSLVAVLEAIELMGKTEKPNKKRGLQAGPGMEQPDHGAMGLPRDRSWQQVRAGSSGAGCAI